MQDASESFVCLGSTEAEETGEFPNSAACWPCSRLFHFPSVVLDHGEPNFGPGVELLNLTRPTGIH